MEDHSRTIYLAKGGQVLADPVSLKLRLERVVGVRAVQELKRNEVEALVEDRFGIGDASAIVALKIMLTATADVKATRSAVVDLAGPEWSDGGVLLGALTIASVSLAYEPQLTGWQRVRLSVVLLAIISALLLGAWLVHRLVLRINS